MGKSEHYKQISLNIKNQVKLLKLDFIVRVEADVDKFFWQSFFQKYLPDKKYRIDSYTKLGSKEIKGVEDCLKYKPYLDKTFFICIDSDYRYLMQKEGININNHIFQTYTYSIENHYCHHSGLSNICKQVCACDNTFFDFEYFYKEYSNIVYELFLIRLHFEKIKPSIFGNLGFLNTINIHELKPGGDWDIKSNCKRLLGKLKLKIDQLVEGLLIANPDINIKDLEKEYCKLGLTRDNVYLYICGHNIDDLSKNIILKIINRLLEEQKEKMGGNNEVITQIYANRKNYTDVITSNLQFEQYPEIDKVKEDILNYFS